MCCRPCSDSATRLVWRRRSPTSSPESSLAGVGRSDGDRCELLTASEDVRLGGGVATLRQYLQAGLIVEMHLAISPVLLGQGENLFAGIDLPTLGYQRTEHAP